MTSRTSIGDGYHERLRGRRSEVSNFKWTLKPAVEVSENTKVESSVAKQSLTTLFPIQAAASRVLSNLPIQPICKNVSKKQLNQQLFAHVFVLTITKSSR